MAGYPIVRSEIDKNTMERYGKVIHDQRVRDKSTKLAAVQ
jgi:hypothetical protein